MLKGIPNIIGSDLLKGLHEMGHGDMILIADGNYPAYSKGLPVYRADGHTVEEMLKAILKIFPMDEVASDNAYVMMKDGGVMPEVTEIYQKALEKAGTEKKIKGLGRYDFYDLSKTCVGIILTTDKTLYANLMIKKGCL